MADARLVGSGNAGDGRGDRDDIEVSVDAALGRAHVAPVAMETRSDGSMVWELRNARDEPGELIVWLGTSPSEGAPVPVTMECRMGRFGDAATEKLIIESISQRLAQLRGRDYYRITWN